MSYCRFQNTLSDLQDCFDVLSCEGIEGLSVEEKKSELELIKICEEINEIFN